MKSTAKIAKSKLTKAPGILGEIRSLIEVSRQQVVATANLALVTRNWHIGRVITEDIQRNHKRADYGDKLISRLAAALAREFGDGFSETTLQEMRRFFDNFEIYSTVSNKLEGSKMTRFGTTTSRRIAIDFKHHPFLSWSHYRLFLSLDEGLKRNFYFEQAAANRWSIRELQRRIDGALFERVGVSENTSKLAVIESNRPTESVDYTHIFKDPYLLDFLGLKGTYSERDLESAIIRNLEEFLAELGNDFCFVRRQYPMRIDDVDYWLDLLFYHRGLRCLVAIDLKLGRFVAADKGQMDLYLAWLKEHEWRTGENEPVGLILCTSKRKHMSNCYCAMDNTNWPFRNTASCSINPHWKNGSSSIARF